MKKGKKYLFMLLALGLLLVPNAVFAQDGPPEFRTVEDACRYFLAQGYTAFRNSATREVIDCTQYQDAQPAEAAVPTAASVSVSLNYDETNLDPNLPGQRQMVAEWLRPAFDQDQTALEFAVSNIQIDTAAAGACTFQGSEFVVPEGQAYMVWISDGSNVTNLPADLDDVFTMHNSGVGKVWVVGPFEDPVPPRNHRTFATDVGEFWAVCVH